MYLKYQGLQSNENYITFELQIEISKICAISVYQTLEHK